MTISASINPGMNRRDRTMARYLEVASWGKPNGHVGGGLQGRNAALLHGKQRRKANENSDEAHCSTCFSAHVWPPAKLVPNFEVARRSAQTSHWVKSFAANVAESATVKAPLLTARSPAPAARQDAKHAHFGQRKSVRSQ